MTKQLFEEELSGKWVHKTRILEWMEWISKSKSRIERCFEYIESDEEPISRRTAYVLDNYIEKHPAKGQQYFHRILNLVETASRNPVLRHSTRMITKLQIPDDEDVHGRLFEKCIQFIMDAEIDVAVKANSLVIIRPLISLYPDLRYELSEILKDQMDKNTSAFKVRARDILKSIDQ